MSAIKVSQLGRQCLKFHANTVTILLSGLCRTINPSSNQSILGITDLWLIDVELQHMYIPRELKGTDHLQMFMYAQTREQQD